MHHLTTSLRALAFFTLLTGFAYPWAIGAIGRVAFRDEAQGSLVKRGGAVVGSALLAQRFTSPRYFHPRPSAADYQTVASGASQLGPTSQALAEQVAKRKAELGAAPPDLLTSSGSGLDPHISPESAYFQAQRVAVARGFDEARAKALDQLILRRLESPQWGVLGQPRVNVLLLNLALDEWTHDGG